MRKVSFAFALLLSAAMAMPAIAQKDNKDNPGQGKGGPPDKGGPKNAGDPPGQGRGQGQAKGQGQGQGDRGGGNPGVAPGGPPAAAAGPNIIVTDRDRGAIYGYYRPLYAAGDCPPGLAKKNNGCLPPGQAKKLWTVGYPLPAGVVYYPLPGVLLAQLSPAPSGYQYVRVANDILMMAIGTSLIVSAVADLGSL